MSNAYNDTHKRISKFIRMPDDRTTAKEDETTISDLVTYNSEREKWYTALDGDEVSARRFVMGRIAMTTDNGMISARNLPSYIEGISYCIDGQMKSDGFYVNGTKVTPNISTVYRDNVTSATHVSLYRWVYTSAHPDGYYVNCPVSYRVVDGKGTRVIDDSSTIDAKRRFDLAIGEPEVDSADKTAYNPLGINSSDELYHKAVLNADVSVADITKDISLEFGENFNLPYLSVNDTGHIYAAESHSVTIPDTHASSDAAGLLTIPTTKPAKIGNENTIGDITKGVALADHQHSAYKLRMYSSKSLLFYYIMSHDTTYDMTEILHAYLPSNTPSKGYLLSPTTTLSDIYQTKWNTLFGSDSDAISIPTVAHSFTGMPSNVNITNELTTVTMSGATCTDTSAITVSDNAVATNSNFAYLVNATVGIKISMSSATSYGYEISIGAGDSSTSDKTKWVSINLDGEYVDDYQYFTVAMVVYGVSDIKLFVKDISGDPALTDLSGVYYTVKNLSVTRLK